jgi:hypothetical protein
MEYWNGGLLEEDMASSLEGHALSWPIPVADVTEHVPPNTTFQFSSIPTFQ